MCWMPAQHCPAVLDHSGPWEAASTGEAPWKGECEALMRAEEILPNALPPDMSGWVQQISKEFPLKVYERD